MQRKMSKYQERWAYRATVEDSLVQFYSIPPKRARELVSAWWARLIELKGYREGGFMHDEPLNTAADLCNKRVLAINEVREPYLKLLSQNYELAMQPSGRRSAARKTPQVASVSPTIRSTTAMIAHA